MSVTHGLNGKTIATTNSTTMTGRDVTFGEEMIWEQVTLTFTDGTSIVYDLSNADLDGDSISEVDRVCPSCNRSFDKPNDDCWLEDVHWRERYDKLSGPVVVLAGHRQSCDTPNSFGPFGDFASAREFVIEQVRDGDWDPDGVTVEFSSLSRSRVTRDAGQEITP